jgi:predicted Fe-Mo cluster-binding NifX family protein
MKVAIPHWQGRVSPVFDVAANVLVVEIRDGLERSRENVALDAEDPQPRATRLAQTGAELLICGAISWPLEMALSAAGIDVIPHTCGEVEQVLAAFAHGQLQQDAFLMPGCCGRRRRLRARRRCRRSAPTVTNGNEETSHKIDGGEQDASR